MEALAASPPFFVACCALLGLIVGSFLNVVIYRLPIMLEREWRAQCAELDTHLESVRVQRPATPDERFNLIVPRSACVACNAPVKSLQNIPLISYVFLKGRCANCGARIGIRYPLVEALTAVVAGVVAWRFGFGWTAMMGLVFSWFLVVLTFIDLDHQLLPDSLTMPLLWIGIMLSLWGPHTAGTPIPVDLRSSVIGAAAGYSSLWCVYQLFRLLTGQEGMGYGDFKLFAAVGSWLGWQMLLPTLLIAAASGALIGLAFLVTHRKDRRTPIPFGPFLAVAAWLMLMYGQGLVPRYFGAFAAPW